MHGIDELEPRAELESLPCARSGLGGGGSVTPCPLCDPRHEPPITTSSSVSIGGGNVLDRPWSCRVSGTCRRDWKKAGDGERGGHGMVGRQSFDLTESQVPKPEQRRSQ